MDALVRTLSDGASSAAAAVTAAAAAAAAAVGAAAHAAPSPLAKAHASDADLAALERRPSSSSGGAGRPPSPALSLAWHARALALARSNSTALAAVAAMRFAYIDETARGPAGERVVVVVPAHLRPAAVTRRELLLHAAATYDALDGANYVVALLCDGADAGVFNFDPSLFAELHAALPPDHRARLAAFYALAPTLGVRAWLLGARLAEPGVYGRVDVVASLTDLARRLAPGPPPEAPMHVVDADAARAHAAAVKGRVA